MPVSIEERRDLAAGLGVLVNSLVTTIDQLTAEIAKLKEKDEQTAQILLPLTDILANNPITENSINESGQLTNPSPATDAAMSMLDEMPIENTTALDAALETTVNEPVVNENSTEIIGDAITNIVDTVAESEPLNEEIFIDENPEVTEA